MNNLQDVYTKYQSFTTDQEQRRETVKKDSYAYKTLGHPNTQMLVFHKILEELKFHANVNLSFKDIAFNPNNLLCKIYSEM